MKITFFELPAIEKKLLKESLKNFEVIFCEEKLDKNNIDLAKDANIISVFINSLLNKEIIDFLPKLKFIATRSTGFEHIDLDYCRQKEIKVSNVPTYGSRTVSEFAFGLILTLSRNIFKANEYIRETSDFNFSPDFQGFDLSGKTVGVIGTGKIGKNFVRIARGFNMNIIAADPHPDLEFAKENSVQYKEFSEVISEADIISLHVPYTKENYHLINKENIAKMKKGVLLINTARGALIDNSALLWGLNQEILGGVGLDVLEGERDLKIETEIFGSDRVSNVDYKVLLEDHILMDKPNVIITPHIAFYSKEAEAEIIKTTIENIQGFSNGNSTNLLN